MLLSSALTMNFLSSLQVQFILPAVIKLAERQNAASLVFPKNEGSVNCIK